ncbi:MAG: hypothetical protein ACPHGV_08750 [Synechococcus sp.]
MPLPSQTNAITPDLRKSGKTPVCALLPQADLSGLDQLDAPRKHPHDLKQATQTNRQGTRA